MASWERFAEQGLSDFFTQMVRTYQSTCQKKPNSILKCLIVKPISKNAKKLERALLSKRRRERVYSVQE